jgi:signal transduction histidine kinase
MARLPRWFPSALPGVVIDAPEEGRERRDRIVDAVIYIFAFGIGLASLIDAWELHAAWLRPIAIVFFLAGVVSLHWRRTHPAAVGYFASAVSVLIVTSGANFAALFNAAIRCRGRDLAGIGALICVSSVTNTLLYRGPQTVQAEIGANLGFAALALGYGLYVRARRQLVQSLREQAEQASEEARAAERRRIAREMHDVLAHRLSLLSVHAGALEFNSDAPAEEVADAAGVIRESARAALEDLRGVIGVLREDTADSLTQPPQPTLADLPALVEESRAAGMRISSTFDVGDAPPSEAVGRTAYRIVQEGLTNARKHAPGAAVTLAVESVEQELRVVIRSLAPVAVPATPLPGARTGLIGLAERVTLADGELEHGVDAEGAFVLRARLPR